MDCPACEGSGEMDRLEEEQAESYSERLSAALERASWPYACLRCGGSGAVDDTS